MVDKKKKLAYILRRMSKHYIGENGYGRNGDVPSIYLFEEWLRYDMKKPCSVKPA
jgi:hypothetical protein